MPDSEVIPVNSEPPAAPAKRTGFQPGHRKFGGRKPKVQFDDNPRLLASKLGYSSVSEIIYIIQHGVLRTVGSHDRTIEPKERVRLVIELLPYLCAKVPQPVEVSGKNGAPIVHATFDITQLMKDPELAKAAEKLSLGLNAIPEERLKSLGEQESIRQRLHRE